MWELDSQGWIALSSPRATYLLKRPPNLPVRRLPCQLYPAPKIKTEGIGQLMEPLISQYEQMPAILCIDSAFLVDRQWRISRSQS